MGHARPLSEAIESLKIQVMALQSSCRGYDEGNTWESIRIAVAVHTIVHDASNRQPSLLKVIGRKEGLRFVSTSAEINPRNQLCSIPLVSVRMWRDSSGQFCAKYLPTLGDSPIGRREVSFSRWWEEAIYAGPLNSDIVTRKGLIFALRNKEGGGHYDPHIHDQAYLRFKIRPIFQMSDGVKTEVLLGAELATMRQIGWELLESLPTDLKP